MDMYHISVYSVYLTIFLIPSLSQAQTCYGITSLTSTVGLYYNGGELLGYVDQPTNLNCHYNCASPPCEDLQDLIWSLDNQQVAGYDYSSGVPIIIPPYNSSILEISLETDDNGDFSLLTWKNTNWANNGSQWKCEINGVGACTDSKFNDLLVFDQYVHVTERTIEGNDLTIGIEFKKDEAFTVVMRARSYPEASLAILSEKNTENSTSCEKTADNEFTCEETATRKLSQSGDLTFKVKQKSLTTGLLVDADVKWEDGFSGDKLRIDISGARCGLLCIILCVIFVLIIVVVLFTSTYFIWICCFGPKYNRGHVKCECCGKCRFYFDLCHDCSDKACSTCKKCTSAKCLQTRKDHISCANHNVEPPEDYNTQPKDTSNF